MMDLSAFLRHQAQTPHEYGFCDCALVLADWWFVRTGIDPAAHLRGTYSTEDECNAVVRDQGGLLRLVSDLARSVGALPTKMLAPGAIAVVRYRGMRFGGIRTPSDRWFIKSANGAAGLSDVRVLRAWSV
jgi:hypothetical protein